MATHVVVSYGLTSARPLVASIDHGPTAEHGQERNEHVDIHTELVPRCIQQVHPNT